MKRRASYSYYEPAPLTDALLRVSVCIGAAMFAWGLSAAIVYGIL